MFKFMTKRLQVQIFNCEALLWVGQTGWLFVKYTWLSWHISIDAQLFSWRAKLVYLRPLRGIEFAIERPVKIANVSEGCRCDTMRMCGDVNECCVKAGG